MRILHLSVFILTFVLIKCERCTYTENCKRVFQSEAPNAGHDKVEFCKLVIELDRCFEKDRTKCEQGTTGDLDNFLQGLYAKDPECSGVPSFGPSTVFIFISSLVITFNFQLV